DGDAASEVFSTDIIWKDGKDPTHTIEKILKKPKGKKNKGKPAKEVEERKEKASFFRIFRYQYDEDEDEDDDDEDEDEESTEEELKDVYGFWSTVNVVELFWETISKYHASTFFGADMTELFKDYEDEEEWGDED